MPLAAPVGDAIDTPDPRRRLPRLKRGESGMDWSEAIKTVGSAVTILSGAKQVFDYLRGGSASAEAGKAIAALPQGADAQAVIDAVLPSIGGNLFVAAGDNGGGAARIAGVVMSAGDGRSRGGDAVFKAGDGGPCGPGGDLVIGPGTYKAGDAKG